MTDDACTVRIKGSIGRRAWSFAFHAGESMRYLGSAADEHVIVMRKPKHAANLRKLQEKDAREDNW